MYIILIGAPNSGKGTIAKHLTEKFNFYHLSTGDLYREEIKKGTNIGKIANEYIAKGQLVPDNITVEFVEKKINDLEKKRIHNIIFDGFPRTITQAEIFEDLVTKKDKLIDYAIYIEIDDENLIKRASNRRVCPKCGRIYNLITIKPKEDELCDNCKVNLIIRDDDKDENKIKERIRVYKEKTRPLIRYYNERGVLYKVNGLLSPKEEIKEVLKILGLE